MIEISSKANSLLLTELSNITPKLAQCYNKKPQSKEQSALNDWLDQKFRADFNNERCFTVTFIFVEGIRREKAIAQYTNFISNLNRKIYGNAYQRFPSTKRIKNVSFIEGNSVKNYHYHSIFVNPIDRNFSDDEFLTLVRECWLKQPKSMKNSDVAVKIEKLYILENWVGYLTKFSSKENINGIIFQDSLDIVNSYF